MKLSFVRILILFCITFASFTKSYAENKMAQDSLEASLLTCSPGEEIWQYYGHTAICVRNLSTQDNWVFNYGLFSYQTPHFIWRFIKGETDYMVGMCRLEDFLPQYIRRGSYVWEDVLNLSQEEVQKLFQALTTNCMPQNATYRYNFIYDNCATRVRDMIERAIDGNVVYQDEADGKSLRDIIHEYSGQYAWSSFGQDLLIGADADKAATRKEKEFAPFYLERDIRNALIQRGDTVSQSLVKQSQVLSSVDNSVSKVANTTTKSSFPLSPMLCVLILLLICLIVGVLECVKKRSCWPLDVLLLLMQGIAGCIITFMFLFSEHPTVKSNWLILLLNPIPLFFIWEVIKSALKNEKSVYHEWARVWIFAFLCASFFIPQYFSKEILLLALSLLLRSMTNHVLHSYIICKLNSFSSKKSQ